MFAYLTKYPFWPKSQNKRAKKKKKKKKKKRHEKLGTKKIKKTGATN